MPPAVWPMTWRGCVGFLSSQKVGVWTLSRSLGPRSLMRGRMSPAGWRIGMPKHSGCASHLLYSAAVWGVVRLAPSRTAVHGRSALWPRCPCHLLCSQRPHSGYSLPPPGESRTYLPGKARLCHVFGCDFRQYLMGSWLCRPGSGCPLSAVAKHWSHLKGSLWDSGLGVP